LLAVAGLPPPVPKLSITDADGRWIARADFAWPEDRVILECDGHAFHDDRATFVGDRRRWTALTRAGWRVVVVTWHDVVDRPARGRAHN
jgi:very-short-patch-repair endonuclease